MEILTVTQEPTLREVLTYHLGLHGAGALYVDTVRGAAQALRAVSPALIIADAAALGPADAALLGQVRSQEGVSLVLLGDERDPAHKAAAAAACAAKFVTIPFYPAKFRQQLAAVLRKQKMRWTYLPSEIIVGNVAVDPERYEIRVPNRAVLLTRLELDMLYFLASRPNTYVPHITLQDMVWYCRPGLRDLFYGSHGERLKWHLYDVRKKIEADVNAPVYLRNSWGIGFGLFDDTTIPRDEQHREHH